MSTSNVESSSQSAITTGAKAKKNQTLLDSLLNALSSVKFGVVLLIVLALLSAIGTFVVQVGTSDFQKFYDSLTPAEKSLYLNLGFTDIYHTWYFNLLLLTLSLNIILATIDRIPGYWRFFTNPKLSISERFAMFQPYYVQLKMPAGVDAEDLLKRVSARCREVVMPKWLQLLGPLGSLLSRLTLFRHRITEGKEGRTVFVERGVWNRYAFCAVHVALLMILIGWFVGNRWGQKGIIQFQPGQASENFFSPGPDDSVKTFKLPFTMVCSDISQDLIDSKKPDLSPQNTLDWHTVVVFEFNGKKFKGDVHLNEPVDFMGYRFFQASFDPINTAREITLLFIPKSGVGQSQEVTLKRNGSVDVPGVGKIVWRDFYPDFRMDPTSRKPFTASGDYVRPVAEFAVEQPDGTVKTGLGFPEEFLKGIQGNAPFLTEMMAIGEYNVILKDFEKVSRSHTLQVQYDPGVDTVYLGCTLLVLFLLMVFFFSHERIWVLLKPSGESLVLCFAGNTNRNKPSFEHHFDEIVEAFKKEGVQVVHMRREGKISTLES